jgi:hypothetical protein
MIKKKIITILIIGALFGLAFGLFVWPGYLNRIEMDLPKNTDNSTDAKLIEDSTDFYRITAKYPVDARDKEGAMEEFVKYQVNQRKEDWKIGGEIYNQEKDVENHFPDRPKMVYSMDINYEKYESAKKGSVSYLFTIGEYTGGANGDERVQSFSFNQDGRILIEDILDLASDHNDIVLSRALLDKSSSDPDKYPVPDMVKDGLGLAYLKDDGITFDQEKCNCDGFLFASNFQNFVIKDDGITFFFNKYRITIGASGVADITLNWSELAPYLR